MPQPPADLAASKPVSPVVANPTPSEPASELPSPHPGDQSSFTTVPNPTAPDTAASQPRGSLAHRNALVQSLLKTLEAAHSGHQDFAVYRDAIERLMAVGPYSQPLIPGYQKPANARSGPEAIAAIPNSEWQLVTWSRDIIHRLLTDALTGLDNDHRKMAIEALHTLLVTLNATHPQFAQGYLPKVRELVFNGHREIWPKAAQLLNDLHDAEWVDDLVSQVVNKKSYRAADIFAQINPEQTAELLLHHNSEVRQLMARVASPEDIKKALAASVADTEVRRTIVQGVGKISVLKGVSYAEHCTMLFGVLVEDPNPVVVTEAGRALVHLDSRLAVSLVVRHIPFLHHTDPVRVARSAQDLLSLDADEDLKGVARAAVERVAKDERVPPVTRAAVERVLHPGTIQPPAPAKAVAVVATVRVSVAPTPPPSEWARRSAAFIEGGGLLMVLQSSNMHHLFFAIQTVNRAWGELTHLRSAPVAARLIQSAAALPAIESAYQPVRSYMLSWALRLDPLTSARYLVRVVQDNAALPNMKTAAVYALSQASTDVAEAQVGRKYVVEQFVAHLRESHPLTGSDYEVLKYLSDFSDLVGPHFAEVVRWIQPQRSYERERSLKALGAFVTESGDAISETVQRGVAQSLGLVDLDILERLAAPGVTRLAELAESADLSLEDRRRVVDVLVKKGEAAHPELVDLVASDNADARLITTLMLIWTDDVAVADVEKLITEATEAQWRIVATDLFEDTTNYVKSKVHILKEGAMTPETRAKQIALARLMALQQSDSEAPAYRKEIAAQYFKVVRVESYSSSLSRVLPLMVAWLQYDELRPIAEKYLRKNEWKSVMLLHGVWQTTTDAPYRQVTHDLLVSIGEELVEKILADRISKSDALSNIQAMQILAPRIRSVLMQRAARNPKAAIAWAEHMGHEGAAFLELLSRHTDPKIQKMAAKASVKMGLAYLDEAATPAGEARHVAETPEAAFHILEGVGK